MVREAHAKSGYQLKTRLLQLCEFGQVPQLCETEFSLGKGADDTVYKCNVVVVLLSCV